MPGVLGAVRVVFSEPVAPGEPPGIPKYAQVAALVPFVPSPVVNSVLQVGHGSLES